MFPGLQAAEVRGDDGADRALVSGTVAVAANVLKNGADIQASTATDAM